MPIRYRQSLAYPVTHQATTGSVWSSWEFANPTHCLSLKGYFPAKRRVQTILRGFGGRGGFTCPTCGVNNQAQRITTRLWVIRCRHCCADVALTSGTVMHATRTPLQTWFLGAYLVTMQTPGVSAVRLQRQLGLARYETALQMLHKLRTGMVRPN